MHIGREKQLEVELVDREVRLADYERKYEVLAVLAQRMSSENRRLKDNCEQYKESLRVSAEKLTEQEGLFSRNFELLRGETKVLER